MNLRTLQGVDHSCFGRKVLDGIDFLIEDGEVASLVAPSGSEKSVIAHIAAGLISPRMRRIMRGYRREAMVLQEPCSDALGHGCRQYRHSAAMAAALEPEHLPKYPVEQYGGMRLRCAIVLVLVAEPDSFASTSPLHRAGCRAETADGGSGDHRFDSGPAQHAIYHV